MAEYALTVDQYMRLPKNLRLEVDAWACREGLWHAEGGQRVKDHLIRQFRLGEGYIDAECCVGPPLRSDGDGNVVTEWRRIPVRTLPPREAFAHPDGGRDAG